MDAKKRVAVPAPWLSRGEGEPFHIIPHPTDGYLMVMPPAEFDRWEQRINDSQSNAAEKRMAIRKFYSEAHTGSADKQGRIPSAPEFRETSFLWAGAAASKFGVARSTPPPKLVTPKPTNAWRRPSAYELLHPPPVRNMDNHSDDQAKTTELRCR